MNVLVAVASRHGSTLAIGEAVAEAIRAGGVDAELQPVEAVRSLDGFDAVVLGSGVYAGHWLRSARDFVDAYEADLLGSPVWLFSSGPLGDPPKPAESPAQVAAISGRVRAREHRVFPGKIDGADLKLTERALIKLVGAPHGDFRPWDDISDWGASIAASLQEPGTASA